MANIDQKNQTPANQDSPEPEDPGFNSNPESGITVKNAVTANDSPPADELVENINKKPFWRTDVKFLALVLVIVVVAILVIFTVISNGLDHMLLSEKVLEKQLELDLITAQTDLSIQKDNDWDSAYDHYVDTLMISVELLDRVHMTYAAVFDENLQNLSARAPSYEGSPFEPNIYPEYLEAVRSNENGNLILPFTPPGSETRDMYLHFQWIPSDPQLPHRLLGVVAISKYTINTRISTWIQITAILLVIASIVIAIFIWRRRMTVALNRTLEQTVKQRTAELEEQTASAKKASLAKSDFLSNMSHEMRTPMNAIIGMTTIAKGSEDIGRKDYCLNKIDDASTHLLNVINDILDMSKIEANKFELSVEKFNFEKLLQNVSNVVIFRVDEKHQDFTVHIDKNIPPYLIGDDQRIMQVITNLMSNAVKFTPNGGTIQLNTCLLEEDNDICTIKIEVTDSGIGISPEQQTRLFSSFVQAENSTTRKFGGTGLGLAISKHIVEMMNGKIWIASELGKGSTFAFTIKLKKAAANPDDLAKLDINWKNLRILVVDESADTREYFSDIMQRFGSGCDVAASGDQARALIDQNGSYNLYFVDWRIQGLGGIEFAKFVNSSASDMAVVIMISTSEWDEIEDTARSSGINKFLFKPIFPSNIANCINEFLGSDSAAIRGSSEINYKGIFKDRRILLAEDVEVNREIVISLLESTQLTIDSAENGLIACEMFAKNPDVYDMIFMDVQMPELDGYNATRKIRSLDMPKAQEIPIIAMTANVFREDVEKCIECGMNDHLGKPIIYDKMISKLCEYLLTDDSNPNII